ncbi:MAG TPA: Trm112 family protein [Desulfobulbus sp.]|nr:Trm112 family protein [Desulfobulbus sp.]
MIRQELLDIIACPKCKGPVQLNEKEDGLVCLHCMLLYAIRDEIPIMLIDEATPLEREETAKDD